MKLNRLTQTAVLLAGALAAPLALAHEGAHHSANWFSGLLHPLTGADHLLAMVLMGVVAALIKPAQSSKLLAAIAALFVAGLALGTQLSSASVLEPVLYGSVVALALFAFGLIKQGSLHLFGLIAVAAFGASHGVVLGTEAAGSVVLFGAGATFTSLSLCGLGFALCRLVLTGKRKEAASAIN